MSADDHLPTEGSDPRLLTVAEAAEILQVSQEAVREWIAAGLVAYEVLPGGEHRLRLRPEGHERSPGFSSSLEVLDLRSGLSEETRGVFADPLAARRREQQLDGLAWTEVNLEVLAERLAARLSDVCPDSAAIRLERGMIVVAGAGIDVARLAADDQRPVEERLVALARHALETTSEALSEVTSDPWPAQAGAYPAGFPPAQARIADGWLCMGTARWRIRSWSSRRSRSTKSSSAIAEPRRPWAAETNAGFPSYLRGFPPNIVLRPGRVKSDRRRAEGLSVTTSRFGSHRVYRSTATTWVAAGCTVGGGMLGLVARVAGPARLPATVAALVLLVAAWRLWNAGIQVGPKGVKVVALFLSRHVPWSEIDHFTARPLGRLPYAGQVVLRDGKRFGTLGLATPVRSTEQNRLGIQRRIDRLNRSLSEWRQTAHP